MRNNYEINKILLKAYCCYKLRFYELDIWYEDMDINNIGITYRISESLILNNSNIRTYDSFNKIQNFLDSDKGKQLISGITMKFDLEKEKSELIRKINDMLPGLNVLDLNEIYNKLNA